MRSKAAETPRAWVFCLPKCEGLPSVAESLPTFDGKYEIVHKLGEGGMGSVYKVRHTLLNEYRVIKTLRAPRGEATRAHERFLREARIAVRQRHTNIAQLFDFSVDADGSGFIVMEYVQGTTLQETLRAYGPPSIGLALELALQALSALEHLHKGGFVHRDVAPDNLMLTTGLDGEPVIKLIDLGIARMLEVDDAETRTTSFLGKYRYAAPEMFDERSRVRIDQRADIYSLGVVLYEVFTGMLPIRGDDVSSLVAGHVLKPIRGFDESDPKNRVPEPLRRVVERALGKKPEDRYRTAGAMRAELLHLQNSLELFGSADEVRRLLAYSRPEGMPPEPRDPKSSTAIAALEQRLTMERTVRREVKARHSREDAMEMATQLLQKQAAPVLGAQALQAAAELRESLDRQATQRAAQPPVAEEPAGESTADLSLLDPAQPDRLSSRARRSRRVVWPMWMSPRWKCRRPPFRTSGPHLDPRSNLLVTEGRWGRRWCRRCWPAEPWRPQSRAKRPRPFPRSASPAPRRGTGRRAPHPMRKSRPQRIRLQKVSLQRPQPRNPRPRSSRPQKP